MDAGLQVGSNKSRVEEENHFPLPAGHVSFEEIQDTVAFLGCKCTCQVLINQYPKVFLFRTALNPFFSNIFAW